MHYIMSQKFFSIKKNYEIYQVFRSFCNLKTHLPSFLEFFLFGPFLTTSNFLPPGSQYDTFCVYHSLIFLYFIIYMRVPKHYGLILPILYLSLDTKHSCILFWLALCAQCCEFEKFHVVLCSWASFPLLLLRVCFSMSTADLD